MANGLGSQLGELSSQLMPCSPGTRDLKLHLVGGLFKEAHVEWKVIKFHVAAKESVRLLVAST